MEKMQNSDINVIISAVRNRDDSAFAELVERYTPLINKVVSSFFSSSIQTEEAFSEACVALYCAALSFDSSRGDITFGLYARICIYRRLCDFVGKDASNKYSFIEDLDIEAFPVSDAIDSSILGQEFLNKILSRAREILSDYEYEVFILYLEGYATADIAEKLCRSSKSIDNAKARIFRRLRSERDSFPKFD